jgi:hypothetical protein
METEIKLLLENYISAYPKIKEVVDKLTDAQINFIPAPGKWSTRQIIHHLCDSEMMAITRIYRILTEEKPLIQGYDQNKWTSELAYDKLDIKVALLTFGLLRERLFQLYHTLPDSAWTRKALHSERGDISLLDMLKIYSRHGDNHLEQIHKNLSAFNSGS